MKELLHLEYRKTHVFKAYLRFYAPYRARLIASLVMFFIKALPVWVIPVLTAEVINMISDPQIASAELSRKLFWYGIIGALIIAQNIPCHIYYIHLMSVPCRSVERNIRSSICTRLQQLSIPYHLSSKLGALQNKVTRDVENIEVMTRTMLETIPSLFFTASIAIGVTACKAPLFLLFYLAMVPISAAIVMATRKTLMKRNSEFRRNMEDMSGKVTEMLRLIPITRAHHVEQLEISRVNNRLEEIRNSGLRVDYINSIFGSVSWAAMMFFNLGTLIFIAILYHKGILKIGLGDVGLLTGYFGTITNTVIGAMSCLPNFTKGLESVRSIGEVLECPDLELNEGKPQVTKVKGDFRFDKVSFRYPGSDGHALSEITMEVKAGETVAFVGPSGAGKSTIAHLLIGFIRPSEGRIFLDGTDMNSLDLRSYRNFISVVTQETLLFNGTIRENICYGKEPASEQQLMQAVKDADLLSLIESLPEGLETPIRENGARLSGGQKQRLAIARALLRNPRVLILDEATSALDIESERQIKTALDRLIAGRTTIVVAHRLSTIRNADKIVVLQNGRIAEEGTYGELLQKNGLYAEMEKHFSAEK